MDYKFLVIYLLFFLLALITLDNYLTIILTFAIFFVIYTVLRKYVFKINKKN